MLTHSQKTIYWFKFCKTCFVIDKLYVWEWQWPWILSDSHLRDKGPSPMVPNGPSVWLWLWGREERMGGDWKHFFIIIICILFTTQYNQNIHNAGQIHIIVKKGKKGSGVWPSMVTHTRNLSSAFNPSKCTLTAVNTHLEQWAAIFRRPGSSWGIGALLKGLTSVVVLCTLI